MMLDTYFDEVLKQSKRRAVLEKLWPGKTKAYDDKLMMAVLAADNGWEDIVGVWVDEYVNCTKIKINERILRSVHQLQHRELFEKIRVDRFRSNVPSGSISAANITANTINAQNIVAGSITGMALGQWSTNAPGTPISLSQSLGLTPPTP